MRNGGAYTPGFPREPRQGTKAKNGEQKIIKDRDEEKEREKVYPFSETVYPLKTLYLTSEPFPITVYPVSEMVINGCLLIYVDPRD